MKDRSKTMSEESNFILNVAKKFVAHDHGKEKFEKFKLYATGKQDVDAYRKAFGLPPETKKERELRKYLVRKMEKQFQRFLNIENGTLVEWSCNGYLGKRL